MSKTMSIIAFVAVLLAAGCATSAPKVAVNEKGAVPAPKPGEVAVFGGIRLIEDIEIYMPNPEQDGNILLVSETDGREYRISCYEDGAFGVFLTPGRYKLQQVKIDGYTFNPDIHLNIPTGYKAIYAGVVELDGSPSGIDPRTNDTIFIYTIRDESKAFADALRKESPGAELDVYKSLFVPDGTLSTGEYPTKVYRAADLERSLSARGDAVEEIAAGGVTVLTYIIDPLWLLTIH